MTPIICRLRAVREARDLTQQQLAELADVHQPTISRLESGKVQRVDYAVLNRICRALNVQPGDILIREADAQNR